MLRGAICSLCIGIFPVMGAAETDVMIPFENFSDTPRQQWGFVADGVMGGVSQGQALLVD